MTRGFRLGGLLIALLWSVSVQGAPILTYIQTGSSIWTVTGGICPSEAVGCTLGNAFSNSAAVVPVDAALVVPIPGLGGWNNDPYNQIDNSQWIVPAVRANGTVKYSAPTIGGGMDYGVYTYQFTTQFTLNAGEGATAALYGWWWADGNLNAACGVMLNSTCVAVSIGGMDPDAYSWAGHLFNLSTGSGFVDGVNTLTFNVDNVYRETGVRADLTLDPLGFPIPEPSTFGLMGAGLVLAGIYRFRR